MNSRPIMNPATPPEITDIMIMPRTLPIGCENRRRYPISQARFSYTTLAAVNPMKCGAEGRKRRLMIVAITPTSVAVPTRRVHRTAMAKHVKPMRSQAKGSRVNVQNTGEIVTFSIPHSAAHTAIAAMSRDEKYVTSITSITKS